MVFFKRKRKRKKGLKVPCLFCWGGGQFSHLGDNKSGGGERYKGLFFFL
jgi:hypothetical protein